MRIEFEMTQEDMDKILNASKPVTYLVAGGIPPRSPQENANSAWDALGSRMGFVGRTVQAAPGKSALFFTAEPAP